VINSVFVIKYWLVAKVTLKYNYEKENQVVDPLREIHNMIKEAIIIEYARICPQTTKSMVKKLAKNNEGFAQNLFDLSAEERPADDLALFNEMARDRLEDQLTFGGSEVGRCRLTLSNPR
jgi:hypothetical protein